MSSLKAGIPKKTLRIALEPEAASIWCKTIPVEKLNQGTIVSFQEDTKYLVLDAGGMCWLLDKQSCYFKI